MTTPTTQQVAIQQASEFFLSRHLPMNLIIEGKATPLMEFVDTYTLSYGRVTAIDTYCQIQQLADTLLNFEKTKHTFKD